MDSVLINKEGNHTELYSSFPLSEKLFNNELIFHNEWRYNENDTIKRDKLNDALNFHSNNYTTPYFCKISNYCTDTPKVTFGLTHFFENFSKKTNDYGDIPRYTCVNNKLFLTSIYSKNLFIINPTTLSLIKKVEMKSNYSTIGASALQLNKNNIYKIQEFCDSIFATTGQFFSLFYNQQKKEYYHILFHSVPSSLEKKIGYKKLPYSIFKLDTTFTKITEYKMDAEKYSGYFCMMTSQGLFIITPNTNAIENDKYAKFTRVEFEN
jgi:hypothetical protein